MKATLRTGIIITTGTAMTIDGNAALYRLMTWLSPSYPVGAFAYSQGLEGGTAQGKVKSAEEAREWIFDSLTRGPLWSDAVLLARAFEAAERGDWPALGEINTFARAFQPTAELRLESFSQGAAFLAVTRDAWPCDMLEQAHLETGGECAYPLAVASAAAGHGVPLDAALEAFLHAGVANLVFAAIRLVPLGQGDGQRLVASFEADSRATTAKAISTALDDLSTASIVIEISSMLHETQTTRLFRS